jgi:hypothetical protein
MGRAWAAGGAESACSGSQPCVWPPCSTRCPQEAHASGTLCAFAIDVSAGGRKGRVPRQTRLSRALLPGLPLSSAPALSSPHAGGALHQRVGPRLQVGSGRSGGRGGSTPAGPRPVCSRRRNLERRLTRCTAPGRAHPPPGPRTCSWRPSRRTFQACPSPRSRWDWGGAAVAPPTSAARRRRVAVACMRACGAPPLQPRPALNVRRRRAGVSPRAFLLPTGQRHAARARGHRAGPAPSRPRRHRQLLQPPQHRADRAPQGAAGRRRRGHGGVWGGVAHGSGHGWGAWDGADEQGPRLPPSRPPQDLLAFIAERPGQCGIIYARLRYGGRRGARGAPNSAPCLSRCLAPCPSTHPTPLPGRSTCDWLTSVLSGADLDVAKYHAGLDPDQRRKASRNGWGEGF